MFPGSSVICRLSVGACDEWMVLWDAVLVQVFRRLVAPLGWRHNHIPESDSVFRTVAEIDMTAQSFGLGRHPEEDRTIWVCLVS